MSKVREPLGNRARIGTQGYLVSLAMMLTTRYPPPVTFSLYAKAHTVPSSNEVLGTWDGNQSSTLWGRAAVTGVKLGECLWGGAAITGVKQGECLCLWAG